MKKYFTIPYKVLYLQILAHLGLAYQLFYGDVWMWIVSLVVFVISGCFGLVMTYHRLLAHNSWPASSTYRKVGSLLGSYAGIGSPMVWTAVHRAHHKFVDTAKDPHSPEHLGFARVQFLGMFGQAGGEHIIDMLRDKFQTNLNRYYFHLHILVGIVWLVINPALFICAYLAPMALLWEIGGSVNTINHLFGYKNKENSKHHAYNNPITGYMFFGEGWHANHHDDPLNYTTKQKWWEFDLAGLMIKLVK